MTPAGFPHSEINGSKSVWRLTVAYRSLPRLSSLLSAKASTVCPYYLNFKITNLIPYSTVKDHYADAYGWYHRSPRMVEVNGFEPMTPCLQGRCSPS